MILQALNQYYEHKKHKLAPEGFQEIKIPFVVVLDSDGNFVQLENTQQDRRAKIFTVPRAENRQGTKAWTKPNLLWDHYGFVLGVPKEDAEKERKTATKQHEMFIRRVLWTADRLPPEHGIHVVAKFLEQGDFSRVLGDQLWPECQRIRGCNLSFKIAGNPHLVCEDPQLEPYVEWPEGGEEGNGRVATNGICLVTGEFSEIEMLHPAIGNVGQKPIPFASINSTENPAFASFSKAQGLNFPVSKRAAFAYATALRDLLKQGSRQKFRNGDTVFVFWAEKGSGQQFELDFLELLNSGDPAVGAIKVQSLFQSIQRGIPITDDDNQRFHVLGLTSPNPGRIAVRSWRVSTVGEVGRKIAAHFSAIEIVGPRPYQPLWQLINSVALNGEAKHLPPNLAADTFSAVLDGLPYPLTLMQSCLRRIRAEMAKKDQKGQLSQNVTFPRAALLKAWLIRNLNDKEITVSLNETNNDPGYRLGRLFAALERIQERAQGNLNASIRERYYGAFSSTPVTVLPLLMKLKNHHLAKLPNRGEAVNLEKLLSTIIDGLGDVPARLSLAEQARFAVGYYHQRQAFFNKSTPESPVQSDTEKE